MIFMLRTCPNKLDPTTIVHPPHQLHLILAPGMGVLVRHAVESCHDWSKDLFTTQQRGVDRVDKQCTRSGTWQVAACNE